MRIFLYEGKTLHGEASYPLIIHAAERYLESAEFDMPGDEQGENLDELYMKLARGPEILVSEKGKPYFVDIPLEFSVSNCEDMWMCAISERPCGIDIQVSKRAPHDKIAARFFKTNEAEYAKVFGEAGFFTLWTRREAYGKMTGEGFWGEAPELVDKDMNLVEKIGDYHLSDIEVGDGIYCAVCTCDSAPYPIILI